MPTLTASTAPDLRGALLAAAADPAWWGSRAARPILDHAAAALAPAALRLNADPAEALSYAFETWLSFPKATLADETADLWAYTYVAVRRALAREDEAARKGTSISHVRTAAARELDGFATLDGFDIGYDQFAQLDESDAEEIIDPRSERALTALEQVLIMAGFTDDQRVMLIDVFADVVSTSPSVRASIARAEQVRGLVAGHLCDSQWRSLVEVILGTPAGKPGILALAGSGHPAPAMEPHVSARLMGLLAVAA